MNEEILSEIIALGEGPASEFKRNVNAALGNELCAFANAAGGIILVGVDDDGNPVGLKHHNRLKSQIQSYARAADPPITVEMESIGSALCVTVPAQRAKPYSFGGSFYVRQGASSQKLTRDEIRAFFHDEGLIPVDQAPCRAFDLAVDLHSENWPPFARRCNLDLAIEPRIALENLRLIQNGHLTNAGAWLLADDITRFALQAGVMCVLFSGRGDSRIVDRQHFTGNLPSIYEETMRFLMTKLNTSLIPSAQGRHERLELPENALREAVVNAIAHRDYRSSANIQISIFQDRVEIASPGGLPAGMREEYLGIRSVPRNPLLFRILYRMDMVEEVGSGIRRIRQDCLDFGVPEPEIEVSENWVRVAFRRSNGMSLPAVPRLTPKEIPHVTRLLLATEGAMSRTELMQALELKDRKFFTSAYLRPSLENGLMEMTMPDKPSHRLQRFRLTALGAQVRLFLAGMSSNNHP